MMPIDDDVHLLFQGTIDDGIDLGEELGRNLGAAVFTNEIVLPGNGKAQVIEALGGGVVDVLRGVFDLPGKGRSDFPGAAKIDAPLDLAGGGVGRSFLAEGKQFFRSGRRGRFRKKGEQDGDSRFDGDGLGNGRVVPCRSDVVAIEGDFIDDEPLTKRNFG